MVNRESNVFPGILGRVCDRPCEPACRRGRVEEKPVAICRLKRVAADHRDDVTGRLPKIPRRQERQAHRLHRRRLRLADRGQRPHAARLRGHHLRAVRRARRPDAHQHPLVPPARRRCSNEEIGMIVDMGVDLRLQLAGRAACARCSAQAVRRRVRRLRRAEGQGARSCPGARRLPPTCTSASPGSSRWPSATSTRSASACSSSASATPPWTAAARACGSARKDVKVMARKPRDFFKASAVGARGRRGGERRDRHQPLAEGVRRRERQADRHDVRADGVRHRRARPTSPPSASSARSSSRPTTSSSPSARRTPSPGSSATSASSSTSGTCRWSTRSPSSRRGPGVFFGGDAAFGPKNIIWAVEHGHQAAISIHSHCQGEPVTERLPPGMNLQSRKMGMHEWSYAQRLHAGGAAADAARRRSRSASRSSTSRSSSASPPSRPRRKCSAASTATCRRCSPPSCASSATPASTSARSTA